MQKKSLFRAIFFDWKHLEAKNILFRLRFHIVSIQESHNPIILIASFSGSLRILSVAKDNFYSNLSVAKVKKSAFLLLLGA